MRSLYALMLWCVACWCTSLQAEVPSRAERIELSANYGQRTRGLVDRMPPDLQFFGEGERFAWYRVETGPESAEVVLLDLRAGRRDVVFDTDQLQAAWRKLDPERAEQALPRRVGVQFSDDAQVVSVVIEGQAYRWERGARTLIREVAAEVDAGGLGGLPAMERLGPSRSGEPTEIELRNDLDKPLDIFWVDTQGGRRSYGRIGPGEVFRQSTYAGHVWLCVDADGREVAAFRSALNQTLAVVTSETPAPQRGRGGRNRGDRRGGGRSTDGRWQVRFENHNVMLVNEESGDEQALTVTGNEDDGFGGRVWWSPDSQHFVVMRTERGSGREILLVDAAPEDRLQPKTRTIGYAKPGDELDHPRPYLFHVSAAEGQAGEAASDLETREQAAKVDDGLFPNPYAINRMEWRADASAFTFVYNQRGHQVLRVISVDAETGEPRAVIDEQSETFVCYSQKFFLERLEASEEMIWMTERDGWNHLILVDWKTGEVKNRITQGPWVVRGVERVDPQSRTVWVTASGIDPPEDPYHRHLVRVQLDGTGMTRLTRGDGDHRWEYSPEGNWLIDIYSRVDLPPVTVIRNPDTGAEVVTAERADWSRLLKSGWRPPERFVAKGRDGETDIYGIVVCPTHFDAQASYPVLEAIYAGPHSSFTPKSFGLHRGLYEMAELGFIVVKLDGMGTSDRSKAFHDVCWQNLADSGFPDRKLWIQAATESRPQMDLTRVGIWGGSAGGQSALRALLSHGDFYHAAAADCGCHDNRMDKIWWNEQWMGWPIGDHYREQSNVTDAHQLQGDLLLTVGALDSNVDPSSTMQVVEALIDADKDFELIVFPRGGHGAGSSPYGKRRMKDFFFRSLGDPIVN